ncbi:hypothetical protein Vretimale_8829 [Volvox reticuliferus]|uniref:Protein kinase domain-containing protein n=1 Tax=Volvox reticuliferus TaxID=1737510 RepID=A0A8J4C9L6_9CHLO|nr:hypothetical protein Vretifemale_6292 [Volvox reticuliferus]GIM04208.1 hypothetical protein Vretimale_8829 [Volvox reticuliferus]
MMKKLWRCLRGGSTLLAETPERDSTPPEQSVRGFALTNRSPEQLFDVLLTSSRTAEAQDWIYRCLLQLDAAAEVLCASVRLYIAKEDGRFELLFGSVTAQTAVLLGPAAPSGEEPGPASRSDFMERILLAEEVITSAELGFETGRPMSVRYHMGNTIAAVPLSCGTECFGALVLVPNGPSGLRPAARPSQGCSLASDMSPLEHKPINLASCEPQLLQLGMALSLVLAPDLPALRRIAISLARLAGGSSLREMVAELCDTLSYYVRQRFLLEPTVRAALVAEADATMGFMLDVSSVPSCQDGRRFLAPLQQQQQPVQPQQQQQHSLTSLLGPGTSSTPLLPSISPGRSMSNISGRGTPPTPVLVPWDPVPSLSRSNLGSVVQGEGTNRLSSMARPGGGKSPLPLAQLRREGLAATESICADDGSAMPQPLRLTRDCLVAACEAAGGSVIARPFQLSYSLLLRLQLQQPRIYGIAVRDCARLVQDINQPSRDVCLLMGNTSTPMPPGLPAGLLGDTIYQQGSSYGYKDSDAATIGASCQAFSARNNNGMGSGVSGGGGGGGGGSSTVQSLVLVGCDASDGVTLAFYVCFPHRLPAQLVEAVRDGCQRLLDRVLRRVVAPKVTGELATELGTLRRGTPGTFAVLQMPYSRIESHVGTGVGPGAGAPSPQMVTGTGPAPLDGTGTAISSSTLGSDLPFGPHFAATSATITATTTNTITVIPQPAVAPATGGGGSSSAVSGSSCIPPQAAPSKTIRTLSTAAARAALVQLDAGGGAASGTCGGAGSSGVGSLQGPESTRAIASCAGIGGVGGSLSELLSHTSSTSASRSRSVTTVRPHYLTTAGSQPSGCNTGGIMVKVAGDRRKTLAGLSVLSTVNNMSGVVVLPSRVPILDTSLGGGGGGAGGADSWMQIAGANTGTGSAADAIQAFLSSSHCVSGSQVAVPQPQQHPADVLRHTASVIIVRDLEAEARGSCQQQLGALVSSVRESITIAATPNPAAGSGLIAANTAPVLSQGLVSPLADGADGAGGGTEGGSAVVKHSGPTTHALYLGWDDSGARGSSFGIGAAGDGAVTNAAAVACGLDSEAADVADLRLVCKLGQGGCGSVFLGQMGPGLEVAVKLLDLPSCFDIEHFVEQFSIGHGFGPRPRRTNAPNNMAGNGISVGGLGGGFGGDIDLGAVLAAEAVRQQVRARRSLLQSATELAMLTSISHPNIVQVYGVYSDVVLETRTLSDGQPAYRLRQHVEILREEQLLETAAATAAVDDRRPAEYSNVCSAVCMTLCDLGSLETALTERGFPGPLEATARLGSARVLGRGPNAASGSGGPQGRAVDTNSPAFGASVLKHMRSVCLTLLEVALALRYLHGRNIIHRDLKPGNILLKSRTPTPEDPRGFNTKLADFGLALVLDREPTQQQFSSTQATIQQQQSGGGLSPSSSSGPRQVFTPPVRYALSDQPCGTVDHMAPEACRGKGSRLTAAVDVYSFGIVMLEMVTAGRRPFGNMPMDRIGRLVVAGTRPLFPAWVPAQYRSLAEACWAQDPAARPTAAQLVVAIRQQLHRFTATAGTSGVVSDSAGPRASPKRVPSTSHVYSTARYNCSTNINNDVQTIAANLVANAADTQPNVVHVDNI